MGLVVGIDLGYQDSQICYYENGMKEPESISVLTGAEKFKIPTVLCKDKNRDYFTYGEEARRMALRGEGILVVDLLKQALENESIYVGAEAYQTTQLLVIFLRKLWNNLVRVTGERTVEQLVITVEETDKRLLELLKSITQFLPLEPEKISVIDYEESFFYYAMLQEPRKNDAQSMMLLRCINQELEIVELKLYGEKARTYKKTRDFMLLLDENGEIADEKAMDCQFLRILQEELQDKKVTFVYLIGELFGKEWMKDSLVYLCRGRRVFKGSNLFVKGSAAAAEYRLNNKETEYAYQGKHGLKWEYGIFLDEGKKDFLALAKEGENWFDVQAETELVLENQGELEIVLRDENMEICASYVISLGEYARREEFITAVNLKLRFEGRKKAVIQVTDLGFGETTVSSGKVWTKVVEEWEE